MVDDLTGPQIASFLDEHVREMLSITPPESKHALDLETLRGPGITFWSVLDGGAVVGCGALKRLDARHAEVKSMRTLAARRPGPHAGRVDAAEHIITEARRERPLPVSGQSRTVASMADTGFGSTCPLGTLPFCSGSFHGMPGAG